MQQPKKYNIYIVHYSKLSDRKARLSKYIEKNSLSVNWVTESDFINFSNQKFDPIKRLKFSNRLFGMDLGINSRSTSVTRRRARFQGLILLIRSYLSSNKNLILGSMPDSKPLRSQWIELQKMHVTALLNGSQSEFDWIMILEDDAIPNDSALQITDRIIANKVPKNTWINLNSGANLLWTKSDPIPDANGLYRVKPASTRCSVAYLISKDLALKIVADALSNGIPNWLPIDVYFQYCLRKFKSISYWQDPPTFLQGSETGEFSSGFGAMRDE